MFATSMTPATTGGPDRRRFEAWLRHRIAEPVEVIWTQNRVRLASCARRGGQLVLRLHALFAGGSEGVAHDLVALLVSRERARGARLSLWFTQAQQAATAQLPPKGGGHPPPPARPAAAPPPPLLAELFGELNAQYFRNGCKASIRWGRAGTSGRRRRRSIQLGCYDFSRREIRLHPALAEPFVPRFVVAMVVYHEMLHEVFGLEQRGSRKRAHPPEFVACEQSHPDYARARAWEEQNLGRLLAWRA